MRLGDVPLLPFWALVCLAVVAVNAAMPFAPMSSVLIGVASSWLVGLIVLRDLRRRR